MTETAMVCKHCGSQIKHAMGRLWHEVGAQVFPQYCPTVYTDDDGTPMPSQLHEPKEITGE
jgi:hypothetical protein